MVWVFDGGRVVLCYLDGYIVGDVGGVVIVVLGFGL